MAQITNGCPSPLGPSVISSWQHADDTIRQIVNIAIFSHRRDITLCLFAPLTQNQNPIRDISRQLSFPACTENVHHICLENVHRDTAYAICIPVSTGESRLLTDPYSPCMESLGADHWMFVPGENNPRFDGIGAFISSFPTLLRLNVRYPFRLARFDQPADAIAFDWGDDTSPKIPYDRLVVYEAHARALAKDGSLESAAARATYFKWLGVTAVQLLPVFEFPEAERGSIDGEFSHLCSAETRDLPPSDRPGNWWGYSPMSWFAPMNRYSQQFSCGGPVALKTFVKALHQVGIECFLDVVYNHTSNSSCALHYLEVQEDYFLCESQNTGPKSFKHSNISGCGNTLSPNCAQTSELILRSLRHFVTEYHIDGFRFDAAGVLCRDVDGMPMENPPVLRRIVEDDILKNVKFIVEGWDAGDQIGSSNMLLGSEHGFPYGHRFTEWNAEWRDTVRRFVRGNCCKREVASFQAALRGSPHLFNHNNFLPGVERPLGPGHSLNFVACHDGFCLLDLLSYSKRVNKDGYDEVSFNCGTEGPTTNQSITDLRSRQLRNFIFILAVSRGIPMIMQGDELGFSKKGNSNTWNNPNLFMCRLPDDPVQCENQQVLVQFVRYMLKLRRDHPSFRGSDFYKDITWLDASGSAIEIEVEEKEDDRHNISDDEILMDKMSSSTHGTNNDEYEEVVYKTQPAKEEGTEKIGKVIGKNSDVVESNIVDNGAVSSKVVDGAVVDGAVVDSEVVDSEVVDSEVVDSEVVDSEVMDGAVVDSEVVDSEVVDSEVVDGDDVDSNDETNMDVVAFIAPSLQTLSTVIRPQSTKIVYIAFNNNEEKQEVKLPDIDMARHEIRWVSEIDTFSSKWRQDPRRNWGPQDSIAIYGQSSILFTGTVVEVK